MNKVSQWCQFGYRTTEGWLCAPPCCSDVWSAPLSDLSRLICTDLHRRLNKISLERLSEGCTAVSERGDYGWNSSPNLRLLSLSTMVASFLSDLVSPFPCNKMCIVCFLPSREGKSKHTAALSAAAFKKNPLILSRSAVKIKEGLFCMPLAEGDEILYFYSSTWMTPASHSFLTRLHGWHPIEVTSPDCPLTRSDSVYYSWVMKGIRRKGGTQPLMCAVWRKHTCVISNGNTEERGSDRWRSHVTARLSCSQMA